MTSETDASSPPPPSKDDGKDVTSAAESSSTSPAALPAASTSDMMRKKRRSDVQINKDDHPEGDGCSDDDDELNDEGGKRSDPFKRAPEVILKKRKIVKASSKWGGGGAASNGGGAFASVNLTAASTKTSTTAPTFGNTSSTAAKKGGFGAGFGAVSQGFGAVTASSSSAATGFGSSNVATSNGFGAKKEDKDKSSTATETKPSVFGGGFGAVSSGFGAAKSGFGAVSTASSSGFGSAVTSTATSPDGDDDKGGKEENKSGDDSSPNKELNGETTKETTTTAQSTLFPTTTTVDVNNGEENEECLCQVLAKLYKMVPDLKEVEGTDMEKGDVPSVPSSSGRFGDVKQDDNKVEVTKSESKDADKDEKEGSTSNLVRKEAGVGNVRVLKLRSFGDKEKNENKSLGRVVQRQRGSNSLILNIRLCCRFHQGLEQIYHDTSQAKLKESDELFVQAIVFSMDFGTQSVWNKLGCWAIRTQELFSAFIGAIMNVRGHGLLRDVLNKCLIQYSITAVYTSISDWTVRNNVNDPQILPTPSFHVQKILAIYPNVVRTGDKVKRLPLHYATAASNASFEVVMEVFEAYKDGASISDPVTGLFPFQLAASNDNVEASFSLLLANPNLVFGGNKVSEKKRKRSTGEA